MGETPKTSAAAIVAAGAGELTVSAALHKAEIDQQIATAKAYPRNMTGFQTSLQSLVTTSVEIAEACEYSIPRDGKQITGPSARFAELLAYAYGNCRATGQIVEITKKHVTAVGSFHDLENNSARQIEVKRRITNKDGRTFNDDMITTACQAAVSIATRNAIVAGIPRALWEPIFNDAKRAAEGSREELSQRVAKLIKAFEDDFSVAPQRLLKRAGYESINQFTQQKLKFFRNLYVALKDGDWSVEEAFPREDAAGKKAPTLDDLAGDEEKPVDREWVETVKARLRAATSAVELGQEMAGVAAVSTWKYLPTPVLEEINAVFQERTNQLADEQERREEPATSSEDATTSAPEAEEPVTKPDPAGSTVKALEGAELKALVKNYLRKIERLIDPAAAPKLATQISGDFLLPGTESADLCDALDLRVSELKELAGG